ncbi:MAG: methylmalonyl-CoA mutase [Actinobacteria bacterium]|nr:methylmalonyl-CoA mutase [Actinomycetota bacterium]
MNEDHTQTAAEERIELDAGPRVKPFYTAADLDEERGEERPGEFPFTRGVGPARQRPLIKFYSGLGTPEQSNLRFRKLAALGVEEIQIAADLPSQIGYDADHVMAAGEVGRAGVSISSLRDMEVLFDGVGLDSLARVSMLGNAIGPIALALFVALGERQGLAREDYVVDLQNDPLKEYYARGTQFLPVEAAVRLAVDVVEWCAENAPHWYPLDACVNHINSAGAGSTAGTAFAIADAIAYVETLVGRGLDVDSFAPQLQMFLDEREDFFVAVANVRATRRVWARLMRDRFGARDPRSMALEVTAYGHGRETRQEPRNNIVRIALGCMAYRLAGVQSMYSASYDEALWTPSDEAVVASARTQQILGLEQGLDAVVDPLGGSYYVEALTDEIEREIVAQLEQVDAEGGAQACIANGYFRNVIAEGAVRRQGRFERGERATVGVNRFVSAEAALPAPKGPVVDPEVERLQGQRLAELRAERDGARVEAALAEVASAAREDRNTVPAVLEAVRAYATIGEICDRFRAELGEWTPDQQF